MESWTERIQGSKLCCYTRPVAFFWYQMEGMQNLVFLHNTTRQLCVRLRAAAFARNTLADAGSGAPRQPAPFRKFSSAQQAQHMRRHLAQMFRQHATVTVGAPGQLGRPTAGTYLPMHPNRGCTKAGAVQHQHLSI